jgi:hypothetical protein
MKIKINALIVTIAFFLAPKTVAQEHTNSWFRNTLSIPVTEKIKTDIELQHRRQNDFESDNPFDKNLMYTFSMPFRRLPIFQITRLYKKKAMQLQNLQMNTAFQHR